VSRDPSTKKEMNDGIIAYLYDTLAYILINVKRGTNYAAYLLFHYLLLLGSLMPYSYIQVAVLLDTMNAVIEYIESMRYLWMSSTCTVV